MHEMQAMTKLQQRITGGHLAHRSRALHNDSATYLWHFRLGHIGVKRMKKLHVDGILESLDACEPCLMGKMTKTPFSGTMDRAIDLFNTY